MDVFNLPNGMGDSLGVEVFNPAGAVGATQWQVWRKPRGCSILSIIAISSGAGGGGGAGNTAGAAKGGGGGGGSSGIGRLMYPMYLIPDELYIQVPQGGRGGAGGSTGSGVAGGTGGTSYIATYPNTNGNNLFGASSTGPGGGGAGTIAAAGSGGSAGGVVVLTGVPLSNFALSAIFLAGVAGAAGGAQTGANGASVTIGTAGQIISGSGGGGSTATDFLGGDITGVANTPFLTKIGGASATAGSNGFRYDQYMGPIYGGCGGGSSNAVTGGFGGSCGVNAPGAGGGGGGAGTTVGGRGGDGGPGLVLMISI